ncbi:MAG: hypothetical protein US53_C0064G0003 [Candidatus Woesebacteria bacterium GW2011_GWA1_37_7]|uniref:Uncharacterized protein n=1 Tax=Candidatus Woesebacteria bacterium GW2011_GWA1_37_7 TaxID=1618545 RepID=A0A0G0GYU2_9BACT|nr:MAG: hypothetical protein US53_C0064G0003 [Candidatus Woesebacteria bacterium GW2011_GWA1_37_7]
MIKQTKKTNILLVGLIIFIFILGVAAFILSTKVKEIAQSKKIVNDISGSNFQEKGVWEQYSNSDYNFSLNIPQGLHKSEFEGQGGYDYFVEFNKTNETNADGVHVGISTKSLKEEVDKVISDITDQSQTEPTKSEEISVKDLKGWRLDYQNDTLSEKRSIVFVEGNKYVYSISSTPNQIEKVMEGFSLN